MSYQLAGGPNLPFYKMTLVLEQLCEDVKLSQKLLSHEKIKAHRKKETQLKNSILFALWTRYQDNEVITEMIQIIVKKPYQSIIIISYQPWNYWRK